MAGQVLRDYQKRGLYEIKEAIKNGSNSVLAVLATGGGKTSIFSTWAQAMQSHGILILVHRRELATQAAARLNEFGTDFGYIMAGEPSKPGANVQIASVQTLVKRIKKGTKPRAKYIICDEAHLSTAETWRTILVEYPDAIVLGFTATPWRLGGAPLVGTYQSCVVVSTPAALRKEGFLCGYQGFSYLAPDLSKVKTSQGDYNQKQSGEAMRQPQIVANIVEKWKAHASHLSTVVFAVTVEHSKALAAEFNAAGARAEHLDGATPIEQRKAILARVESGVTQVLCNVGVAVEGLDIPRLKCCILARPTKSLARAIQMMGRVRRMWGGLDARIHDHAFNIKRHGLPDAERDYSLDCTPEDPPSLTTCKKCFAVYEPGESCPLCGPEERTSEVGERGELATVADAEIFEFSSATADDAPAHVDPYLAPVAINWGSVTIGRIFEGLYESVSDEKYDFGVRKRYVIKGAKRTYHLPGTARLNQRMQQVKTGAMVRVTYKGQAATGYQKAHEFSVEADEPEDDPRWAELKGYYLRNEPRPPALRTFEGNALLSKNPAKSDRVKLLREETGFVPRGSKESIEGNWVRLEMFYRKEQRLPAQHASDESERALSRFQNGRVAPEGERMRALRESCGVREKWSPERAATDAERQADWVAFFKKHKRRPSGKKSAEVGLYSFFRRQLAAGAGWAKNLDRELPTNPVGMPDDRKISDKKRKQILRHKGKMSATACANFAGHCHTTILRIWRTNA